MKDFRQICTRNTDVHVHCALYCTVQTYELERVLQGPGKFQRLIFLGLSNKVYNLNIYMLQSLYITKFISNKVYNNKIYTENVMY
jgi:hypothetical protein